MPEEPTMAVLATKMDGLKELFEEKLDALKNANEQDHKATNDHLEKLNGQTAKNTSWRLKGTGIIAVALIVIPVLVSKVANKIWP